MANDAGGVGDHNPQFVNFTDENISDIVREAVGGVKSYIDEALAQQKENTIKSIETFKIAYVLRSRAYRKERIASATLELSKVEEEIAKRNKLIRIADKSEDGWKVVDEYLSEELASDSDDEKKIRAAQSRAASKRRRTKAPKGKTPYQRVRRPMAPESHPNPESGSFRRYLTQSRPQLGQAGGGFRQPRGTDLCFACGKPGHWRRNCQSNVGGKSKDGSSF
ncbi:uncharacterized protein LOC105439618 [Strongylocentrotus purpuratus]|uniref:CCHC-type domain-containing protein n=1 Tax=Strongylocentrotus purpuratus TaxID=7668 RepID=A0A7M7NPV6_STRPU|nr:uncharacterized protein LOC105439618 [Strongylocentrotus purpuratus]